MAVTMQERKTLRLQPDTAGDDALQDDVRLMRAAQQDRAQFSAIYERYFDRIYGYCLRRVSVEQEAEDLTSVVFIRALRSLPTYRGGSVRAWLFRIAHNAVVNHLRDRKPQVSLEANEFDFAEDAESLIDGVVQAQEAALVRQLVSTLPEDQQNLLTLKLVSGLNSQEIAAVVGKRPGAVRTELHRIIKKLRVTYEKQCNDAKGEAGIS